MKGLQGLYMTGPTRVLIQDPCPVGLPEILAVTHMKVLHSGSKAHSNRDPSLSKPIGEP